MQKKQKKQLIKERKLKKNLAIIFDTIKKAAKYGEYRVGIHYSYINDEVVSILRSKGFSVELDNKYNATIKW